MAKFGHAESAAIKRFKDGTIPLAFGSAEVNASYQLVNFFQGKDFGELEACLRGLEKFAWVGFDVVFQHQITVEGTDTREDAGLRTGAYAAIVKAGGEIFQMVKGDIGQTDVQFLGKVLQFVQIPEVCVHGVGG